MERQPVHRLGIAVRRAAVALSDHDPGRHVVVEAVEIQRLMDVGEVARGRLQERLEQVPQRPGRLGIPAEQHRVGEDPVVQQVEQPRVDPCARPPALPQHGRVHVGDAHATPDVGRAQCLRREAVPEQLVVRRDQCVVHPGLAGRMHAQRIPVEGDGGAAR